MEDKRRPMISPKRERELREILRARERGETPPVFAPEARPAEPEIKPKGRGPEGLGTGRISDNMKGLGGNEGFGHRFRG